MSEKTPQCFLADGRGQTLQDYALGISVFLLTLFFVWGVIMPSVLAPFDTETGGEKISQADRVSQHVITNSSVPGRPNRLNVTRVETVADLDTDALRDRYGLPETASINISLRTLNGTKVVTSDSGITLGTSESTANNQVTTNARIVTLSDDSCKPACRLVVGVW